MNIFKIELSGADFHTRQHNFLMCLHFTMIVILIWLEGLLWSWSCVRGFDINGCPIARGKWKWHPTCPIGSVKMILWYVQFLKSKMINIELFSVGSRSKFYLNIALYVSCILLHFVLFFWLWNSPFWNKDRVIYISQSLMLIRQQRCINIVFIFVGQCKS